MGRDFLPHGTPQDRNLSVEESERAVVDFILFDEIQTHIAVSTVLLSDCLRTCSPYRAFVNNHTHSWRRFIGLVESSQLYKYGVSDAETLGPKRSLPGYSSAGLPVY